MALVTVQRSPSSNNSPTDDRLLPSFNNEMETNRNRKSLSECYFAGKGTALVLPDASSSHGTASDASGGFPAGSSPLALRRSGAGLHDACDGAAPRRDGSADSGERRTKEAASAADQEDLEVAMRQANPSQSPTYGSSNIQRHLQSMFYLLRPEETLKMAVKLESVHPTRTRYLVVVSRMGTRGEESCLLGIDCNELTTVGLVLRVLANTQITLDGDGGFSVTVCDRHHIFKPVSVQAMWSALQTLHKVSGKARDQNYFQGGGTHGWVDYYEQRIHSDRSCLNEWHAMDNLESKRPPSPDSIRTKPTERKETEKVIRTTLKEIMMTVDLDEVTSKVIRSRLEEELDMDLDEYKSFIDQEMLVILGQMDAPTEIFDHVYLGSEWNASNYEELTKNGVGHILNVTREIDNFFPGTFDYLNVRVYDDERTDLLKHWDDTFKYITKAKSQGSKVLVHCKMGVSRSASVVIAYAMKAYNWDFNTALKHVKEKRSCIKPNHSFLLQLETYQGILDAMKNKEKLQRSKSETNLKSPNDTSSNTDGETSKHDKKTTSISESSTSTAQLMFKSYAELERRTGQELRRAGARPKSWSPENPKSWGTSATAAKSSPAFMSLEDLSQNGGSPSTAACPTTSSTGGGVNQATARHVLMPFDNGETYSVSPNQIVHLPGHDSGGGGTTGGGSNPSTVKVCVLNLATQFEKGESSCFTSSSDKDKEPWDPGEHTENQSTTTASTVTSDLCNSKTIVSSENIWTSTVRTETTSVVVHSNNSDDGVSKVPVRIEDPFSNHLDRVFDREEKRQLQTEDEQPARECPSRQSSWSSYDSAVVCELSRHSSWGSGDTRTLPSRNSSWGSYDMRPREKGMVKRSKQKIEEYSARKTSGSDSLASSCVSLAKTPSSETLLFDFAPDQSETNLSAKINIPQDDSSANSNSEAYSRLSISAPEPSSMEFVSQEGSLSLSASNVSPSVISTTQCSSVKQHRSFLENMQNNSSADNHNVKKVEGLLDSSGKVQNLKKEFEAKSNINCEQTEEVKKGGKSLPSSPVSVHQAKEENKEDFKSLIGMFENNHQVNKRPHRMTSRATNHHQHANTARYSCIEVSQRFYPEKSDKRPPIAPVVRTASPANLVATVITAAAKKKQQQYGKSHPLAKLNVRPRHNNPVYNTM
ncbi:unnamed protein product [Acanthoscelides obtectus]|uniref:protein-serine/threonine phosphatase n=1 Tax=Acanthoscelides obtectus TaxID=200917 RepID=A0A9P0LHA9_ACAOB|nr:unnamed protein product [Acanthoscelides obtectus]CAK1623200.1 Protein phosphatase Slingshot [Acanthoscelides obtectus]